LKIPTQNDPADAAPASKYNTELKTATFNRDPTIYNIHGRFINEAHNGK
jgi:hypothetical protein